MLSSPSTDSVAYLLEFALCAVDLAQGINWHGHECAASGEPAERLRPARVVVRLVVRQLADVGYAESEQNLKVTPTKHFIPMYQRNTG